MASELYLVQLPRLEPPYAAEYNFTYEQLVGFVMMLSGYYFEQQELPVNIIRKRDDTMVDVDAIILGTHPVGWTKVAGFSFDTEENPSGDDWEELIDDYQFEGQPEGPAGVPPLVGYGAISMRYSALVLDHWHDYLTLVQFNTPDFISGAMVAASVLGVEFSEYFNYVHEGTTPCDVQL